MIVTILFSRLLGFVRESLLLYYFGRGALTDIYKQSFMIPDALYFLIAGGALSSAFIPVFTRYITEGREEDAWKTFSVVACVAMLAASAFIILGEIFAVPLSRLLSPGFRPEQINEVAYLTRIILPAQAFFFLGGLMMGTLYSRNHFLAPALGPLIYNVGIIAGGLITAHFHKAELKYLSSPNVVQAMHIYFSPTATPAELTAVARDVDIANVLKVGTRVVSGYSWGALIGAFVGNFCMQLVVVKRMGMRFIPSFDIHHEGVKKVFLLMLPVIFGLSLPQVDVQINKYFGTFLAVGAVTALDNANRLMQLPYGVFGQAFGTAVFPALSALAAKSLWDEYRAQLSQGIRGIVFLTLPASVLMMVLAVPIVRLVFEHGKLVTPHDTYITAVALVFYCAGVFVWSMQAVVARGFYALHDTLTVIISGTVATVLFIIMNVIFVRTPWAKYDTGPAGLALTTTLAASVHTGILMWLLSRRIGGIDGRKILSSMGKMMLASAAMAAAAGYIYGRMQSFAPFEQFMIESKVGATLLEILAAGGAGAVVYAAASYLLKIEELQYAVSMFKGKFRRKASK
jgi:putative peptidoglycan lipid II flippase